MKFKKLPHREFLKIYRKVPRATVDVVIRSEKGILLTKRDIPPYKGKWHIPGGTILFKESISHAAARIIKEELGIKLKVLQHLGVIENLHEGGLHTVGNIYLAEIKSGTPVGSKQGKEIKFFKKPPLNCIPEQKKFLEKHLLKILNNT